MNYSIIKIRNNLYMAFLILTGVLVGLFFVSCGVKLYCYLKKEKST